MLSLLPRAANPDVPVILEGCRKLPCGQGGNHLIIKSKSLCNFFSSQRQKDQQVLQVFCLLPDSGASCTPKYFGDRSSVYGHSWEMVDPAGDGVVSPLAVPPVPKGLHPICKRGEVPGVWERTGIFSC